MMTSFAETDNHDDITKELPQRTPVNTELQIQQTGVIVLTQLEANEESEAIPTVQLTADVTKTQQCHINDLPSCVNSKVRLFADDCLLYREIKNNQDQKLTCKEI